MSIATFSIIILSITTFNIATLSVTTLSVATLSIMIFNIKTLNIKGYYVTLSIADTKHSNALHIQCSAIMLSIAFYI